MTTSETPAPGAASGRSSRSLPWIAALVLALAAGAWSLFGARDPGPGPGGGQPGKGTAPVVPRIPDGEQQGLPPGASSAKIGPLTPDETAEQEIARLEQCLFDSRYPGADRVAAIGRLYELDESGGRFSVMLADMLGSVSEPGMAEGLCKLANEHPDQVLVERMIGRFLLTEDVEMRRAFLRGLRPNMKKDRQVYEQIKSWQGDSSPELDRELSEALREAAAAHGGAGGGG